MSGVDSKVKLLFVSIIFVPSDAVLKDVLVRTQMYQDQDNGSQRRRPMDEVVSLGPNRTIRSKVSPAV